MSDFVVDELKGSGERPIGVEGLAQSRWVLIDYGDVICHIFNKEMRHYYDIDGLWADAPLVDTGLEADKPKEAEQT
jgi:ribosome-associated protein